jgi:GAF domain-containing protein
MRDRVNTDLGEAMAKAARSIHTKVSLDETLSTIATTALLSVPHFDAVGISTIDAKGNVVTRAATGDLVWQLDALQYELGEGPCVETLREAEVVVAPEIRHDQRWPRYVPRAVELGLRSQLAVKLYLDDEGTLGGLNLYSTESEEIHPEAEGIAELFAAHAAIALGNAREIDGLNEALNTRKAIGQAIGMLMNQYTLSEDAAFGLLVRMSSHSNVKLRDIAARMVEEANEKAAAAKGEKTGR